MSGITIHSPDGMAANVDNAGRLSTKALVTAPFEIFTHQGTAFWLATDFIALTTTASFTGILYIKNTQAKGLTHFKFIRQSSQAGTQWKFLKNPTAGTLISAGTDILPVNADFSSPTEATGVFKVGVDAQTVTDGTHMGQHQTGAYSTLPFDVDGGIALGPGDSFVVLAKPSVACDVGVTLTFWEEEIGEHI